MVAEADKIKIAVVGGDERQIYCAKHLSDKGFEVALFGFEKYDGDIGLCTRCIDISDALSKTRAIVLPMPTTSSDGSVFMPFSEKVLSVESICRHSENDAVILAGNPGGFVADCLQKYGFEAVNYFDREELLVVNAYLTAESALAIAINSSKTSLISKPVLVIGYGRIGKILCHILKAMGVNVYASARKNKDFAWIRAFGYTPVNTENICEIISDCGLVFNTVPNLVLDEKSLCCLPEECLIIDLASKPGGVDFESAKNLGLKVIWALALPGKFKCASAGKIVADTVISILEDMEVIQ